jgi:hypothetical protein
MRVFGCTAYAHIPRKQRQKLNPVTVKGKFVGYEQNSKAYRIYASGQISVSRSVKFDETPVQSTYATISLDSPEVNAADKPRPGFPFCPRCQTG